MEKQENRNNNCNTFYDTNTNTSPFTPNNPSLPNFSNDFNNINTELNPFITYSQYDNNLYDITKKPETENKTLMYLLIIN